MVFNQELNDNKLIFSLDAIKYCEPIFFESFATYIS